MNKKILLIVVLVLVMITACSQVSKDKLNEEALALTADDVPGWLDKHDVDVPEYGPELNVDEFVLEVIENAEKGIDNSVAISASVTVEFIKDIQEAAGYSFKSKSAY
jgi:peptidoglycan hydrolase CwlO-like protein